MNVPSHHKSVSKCAGFCDFLGAICQGTCSYSSKIYFLEKFSIDFYTKIFNIICSLAWFTAGIT